MAAEPALVEAVDSELEAEALASAIRAAGVDAQVVAQSLAGDSVEHHIVVADSELEAARQAVAEARQRIDWENVDVGERVDNVPLRTPGRMPLAARLGWLLAVLLVLAMIVMGFIAIFV